MANSANDSFLDKVRLRLRHRSILLQIAMYNFRSRFMSQAGFERSLREHSLPPADFETFYSDSIRSVEIQDRDKDLSRVILTCYFTSKPDPIFGRTLIEPDINYIAPWYGSMVRLGLPGIIIHDGLPQDFIDRHETDLIQFRRFHAGKYSIFEERWIAYYLFISKTKVESVFCTDANDVYITSDPFAFATDPQKLYVGRDRANKIKDSGWLLEELQRYEQDCDREAPEVFRYQKMYNAGVVGGSRPVMLLLISMIIDFTMRAETGTHKDMSIINLVIHEFFHPHIDSTIYARPLTDPADDTTASGRFIVSGYPLNSEFNKFEKDSKAIFIHK
jgi:hypothetical protein